MKKKIFCWILILVIVIGNIDLPIYAEENSSEYFEDYGENVVDAENDIIQVESLSESCNGTWGRIYWSYDSEEEKLTLSGEGEVRDKEVHETYPWDEMPYMTVVIGEGITSIPYDILMDNLFVFLHEVYLPSTLKTVRKWLGSKKDITRVYYNGTLEEWNAIEMQTEIEAKLGYIFNDYQVHKEPLYRYIADCYLEDAIVYLPTSIRGKRIDGIDNECFSNNDFIEEVIIPESYREVRQYAFRTCSKLKKVTFPKTLEKIQYGCFDNCPALESLEIPAGVSVLFGNGISPDTTIKKITNHSDATAVVDSSQHWIKSDDVTRTAVKEIGKGTYERVSEYKLSFDLNGGSGTIGSMFCTIDEDYIVPACTGEYTGFKFVGWNSEKSGNGIMYQPNEVICNLAKDKGECTLYAQWEAEEYTITYDANGGTLLATEEKIKYNSKYGELQVPEREGYSFLGWFTEAQDGEHVTAETICRGNAIIYAHWTAEEYTLTYDVNGGQELPDKDKKVMYDAVYGSLPIPQRSGYVFQGWFTATENGEEVTEDTICKGNAIIYAIWMKNTEGLKVRLLNPGETYVYTGSAIKPSIIVTNNGIELVEGIDYSVKYINNINASTNSNRKPQIIVTGKGNLAGNSMASFEIMQCDINTVTVGNTKVVQGTKASPIFIYNGRKLTSKDYYSFDLNSVFYEDSDITIRGIGNFTGEKTVHLEVGQKGQTNKVMLNWGKETLIYNGHEQTIGYEVVDSVTKKRLSEDEYIVMVTNNINAGSAKITVVGIGNYSGMVTKNFTIKPSSIGKVDASRVGTYTFANKPVTIDEDLIITGCDGKRLVKGIDYKISYSSNTRVGTGKYTVSFLGNYKATTPYKGCFTIREGLLQKDTESIKIVVKDLIYSGKPGTYASVPYVTMNGITMKKTDYDCIYYYLDGDKRTEITSKNPIKLKDDETIRTIYVELRGKGNFITNDCGPVASYKVMRKASAGAIDLSKVKVTILDENNVKRTKFEYMGGQEITPTILVEYKAGREYKELDSDLYTINYSNNVCRGKATIVINGNGVETIGSKTVTFNIVAKNIKNLEDFWSLWSKYLK